MNLLIIIKSKNKKYFIVLKVNLCENLLKNIDIKRSKKMTK